MLDDRGRGPRRGAPIPLPSESVEEEEEKEEEAADGGRGGAAAGDFGAVGSVTLRERSLLKEKLLVGR